MSCTNEDNEVSFATVKEYLGHEKSGHKIMPKVEPATVPNPSKSVDNPPLAPVQPKREPIALVYKFLGSCEICNNPVDTIKVELGDKDMMIAYCPVDRKQWTSQNVIPIVKQLTEFTKTRYIIDKKK